MSTTETAPARLIPAGTWTIDASHSSAEFSVRHVMVGKTRGRFADFAGVLTIADDPLASSVEATFQMASVDTHDAGRDTHLRSGDFFDVETFPTMTFTSTSVQPKGSDHALVGELTIKGVTRPVTLSLDFNGVAQDPWGGTRAGFSAETTIERKDFGLTWNATLDAGGVLVGDKVKIALEIEAVKG